MIFILSQRNIICIKCEKSEHLSQDCTEVPLPHLKQAVLQNIILSDRNALLSLPSSIRSLISVTISFTSAALRVDSHSVTFEFSDLNVDVEEAQSINALIEEGSDLNKRSHVEETTESLLVSAVESHSDVAQRQSLMFQMNVSQISTDHSKKKDQKCTGKSAAIASLIDLMNETTDFMKKQVSVRQLLKTQKVNIT